MKKEENYHTEHYTSIVECRYWMLKLMYNHYTNEYWCVIWNFEWTHVKTVRSLKIAYKHIYISSPCKQ